MGALPPCCGCLRSPDRGFRWRAANAPGGDGPAAGGMPVPPRPGTATTRAGGPVAAVGRCPLAGVAEHLAVAHRSGRQAIAGPLGGHGLHGPAEAMGGGLDGAIGATGTTVEQQLHQPAGGGGSEGGGHGGDRVGRPIENTATASHHQGAAMGTKRGVRQGWIRQQAKRRLRGRICGPWKEQTHGRM